MANKAAYVLQSGTNNYLSPAEAFNGVATDIILPGVIGNITNTSGVAPATGGFAVNAQGSPNMTVAVSAGVCYVNATPTSGNAQMIRVKMDASENVTIAANSTGSTRYDFVYVKVDADKMNNPAANGLDAVTLTTQRSTTQDADSNGALANATLIAVVTVSNGASSISNSNITDRRLPVSSQQDGWQQANETWTYASATTITVPSGATFKYAVGDKVKIMQSGAWKYFYIVTVADTLLTVAGGSDYTVANATIAAPCYSKRVSPVGFPQWFNWTPTWTNFTVGSGTVTARFSMVGKNVEFMLYVLLSGSTMGSSPTFSLPVTSSSAINALIPLSDGRIEDLGTTSYLAKSDWASTTTSTIISISSSSQGIGISSTSPMTWANNDKITLRGSYPAA